MNNDNTNPTEVRNMNESIACMKCWGRGKCVCTDAGNTFEHTIKAEWVYDEEEGGYLLHLGRFTTLVRELDDYADYFISFKGNTIEWDELPTLAAAREAAERELRELLGL